MKAPEPGSKAFALRAFREATAAAGRKSFRGSKPNIAPVRASVQLKETTMSAKKALKSKAKVKRARSKKARVAAKTETVAAPASDDGPRKGSKLAVIVGLLKRNEGCTVKDVLAATGWPTVSMPQQAKAAGLSLKKEKDGSVTRYRAAA
jgi:hypothetical protein